MENKENLDEEETFVCEICGEDTPIDCEGTEPHTCAKCMPFDYGEDFWGYIERTYPPR